MDTDLIFRLKEHTIQDMRNNPLKMNTNIVTSKEIMGNDDIKILTHEYSANQSDFHGHDFIEINYVVSGCCHQNLDGKEQLDLYPGNVCILNPMARHSCNIDSENNIVVNIIMSPHLFNTAFFSFFSDNDLIGHFFLNYLMNQSTSEGNYLIFKNDVNDYTDFLVSRIIFEYLSDNPYKHLNINNLINLFFSELLHNSLSSTENQLSKIDEIMNYIGTHLESATLKSVAKNFYMHPNYLSSYIKKHTNKTFAQIISEYRIAQAKHLLLTTTLSIDEISTLLGYSDSLCFNNMLKKNINYTAAAYRKKYGNHISNNT